MAKTIILIVIVIIGLLYSCHPFEEFDDNGTLYQSNQYGISLKLFPDSTFNYLNRRPRDTSYGTWTISDEKYLLLNSPYDFSNLPMIVIESSLHTDQDSTYFCIYDMNGEIISREDIQYVIIINDSDTIWEMVNHKISLNDYHFEIEQIQVALIDIDPPYTAFILPTNGDLLYEKYTPTSSESNIFILNIYYKEYLWNYIGLDNAQFLFRRNKLIFENRVKLYKE
jgi:hypothetical protein